MKFGGIVPHENLSRLSDMMS